ncbi:MAG TPA: hypothetical protein DCZ71_05600 [Ruminococcus sp.]|nr:hypothetical protein [Ruminococcus sp.]
MSELRKFARVCCLIAAMVIAAVIVSHLGYPKNYSSGYSAEVQKSMLYDDRGLFSEQELEEINQKIRAISEASQLNIYLYLSGGIRSDWETQIYADDEYDRIFGEDSDGLYYYMDFSQKTPAYDYLSLSGRACLLFDDSKQGIVDMTGDHFPSSSDVNANGLSPYKEQIKGGIDYFLGCISSHSDGASEANYVHTDNGKYIFRKSNKLYVTYSKPPFIKSIILIIGEIAGSIIGLIVYGSVKNSYRFKGAASPASYVSKADIRFYTSTDAFLRTNTSRYAISSGNGGGGRTGGGGGGHSFSGGHTGAGHHR